MNVIQSQNKLQILTIAKWVAVDDHVVRRETTLEHETQRAFIEAAPPAPGKVAGGHCVCGPARRSWWTAARSLSPLQYAENPFTLLHSLRDRQQSVAINAQ